MRNCLGIMNSILLEYKELLRYGATLPISQARDLGRKCSTSAIYAHYWRATSLETHLASVLATAGDEVKHQCFRSSYRMQGEGAEWICVYVGLAGAFSTGRTAAHRFRHEFGLDGYFQQAPILEAICALVYRPLRWTPISRGKTGRVYLPAAQKLQFLSWCNENIRCAFQTVALVGDDAKRKLEPDERALIAELSPLLNDKFSENPFRPYLKAARRNFRTEAMAT
jgi:hypothetical protein